MKLNRLQELKRKLINGKDFSEIWLFYMDHFANHREFTDLGEPSQNSYLNALLLNSCQRLLGKNVKITSFFPVYIKKYQLFHGPFMVAGWLGGVIYFEDIKTGMLALSAPFATTNEVKYLRFSEAMRLSEPNDQN